MTSTSPTEEAWNLLIAVVTGSSVMKVRQPIGGEALNQIRGGWRPRRADPILVLIEMPPLGEEPASVVAFLGQQSTANVEHTAATSTRLHRCR